ncbi:hypothetical protein GSI_03501 [Ganoderma sinense ZZ0214-1]|uniref:Protein kinase domain-containing protein n=1 Tax=Ganoderma sinense ZZ0214-1 TaxID=1077348 RepID=A0A2G8SLV3_9APHY|nr:hypothetical protein GSI_03501 [Ganoderma sinense ZZ0214-1]
MDASPIFFPGQTVTLQTQDPERTLTFTIDRPFAPFTKAVVLLARCPELSPDPVVLKIYDPRFLDERLLDTPHCPARPWSLELEKAADAIWDDPFDELDLWEDQPAAEDADGRAARAALWEKHYRILSTGCFKDEREVYDRLRPLQGSAIPRLLATGTVLPPDERAVQPPAVVLEYIHDAVSLCDVPVDVVTPELCANLLHVVDGFAGRGVVHADVNWNNVLFTPRDRPTRVVIIDFGCGGVRTDDQDDDAWRECVAWNSDSRRVRRALEERGICVPDV